MVATVFPSVGRFFLPVVYLNTHFHELCHALVALACGGEVEKIVVNANGSGVTPIRGGNVFLEASAGYLGATIVGAMTIFFSRRPEAARNVLRTLAIFLGVSLMVFVRGDSVGVVAGIFWVFAILAASRYLSGQSLVFSAQLLGLFMCLNAIQSVYTVLQISALTEMDSDAKIVASVTGLPPILWASMWCLTSLVLVGTTLRHSWNLPTSGLGGSRRPDRKFQNVQGTR